MQETVYYDIAHFVNIRSNLAEVWPKATLVGVYVWPTFFLISSTGIQVDTRSEFTVQYTVMHTTASTTHDDQAPRDASLYIVIKSLTSPSHLQYF